jgi:hypothetical protein
MRYITPTTIVVAVAALAGAGTAAADVHIDPSGHGGRSVEPVSRMAAASAASSRTLTLGGHSGQGQPVVATVSKGRKSVRLNLAFTAACRNSSDPMFAVTKLSVAKVRKARYSLARSTATSFDDGFTLVESYRASGRVRKSSMNGVVRIKDTWYQPSGAVEDSCDSGRHHFALQRKDTFAGTTNDGDPAVVEYTASHDRVKSVRIPWVSYCDSGSWIWGTTNLADTVRQGGAFGGTWSKAVASADGSTTTSTYTLGGALLAHSAFGTWNVTASITDSNSNEVDSCASDLISFRVK